MLRITKFSQITVQLPYPPKYKGQLQSIHATVITELLKQPKLTRSQANTMIKLMNVLSLRCLRDEDLGWSKEYPLVIAGINDIDDDELQSSLGDMYIIARYIDWALDDIELVASQVPVEITSEPVKTVKPIISLPTSNPVPDSATPKEALYIQPPTVPQFDINKIYAQGMIDDCMYTIYTSLPLIPTTQNEISLTTDVNIMSDVDLLKLFPNHRINTRSATMYEPVPTLTMHRVLGNILPVEGYTEEQLIDNLVKYPHLYKLVKQVDGDLVSFYTSIEIDGELHSITDVWKDLPESNVIPYHKDYLKEYVVRRYLLERDVKGIHHKYPMYGALDPYLTLFTSIDEYLSLGYKDVESIARSCVLARVAYKQTRNPVLRRLNNV